METKFGLKKLAVGVFLDKNNLIKRIDIGGKISIDDLILHLKDLKERLERQNKEVN